MVFVAYESDSDSGEGDCEVISLKIIGGCLRKMEMDLCRMIIDMARTIEGAATFKFHKQLNLHFLWI